MSKLIDKLLNASRTTPQPMGFKAIIGGTQKPKMVLIARLTQPMVEPELAKGADAVLWDNTNLISLKQKMSFVPDIPWGIRLNDAKPADLASIDVDFIVFSPQVPLNLKLKEGASKIIEIDASVSESLLRGIGDLPIQGALIDLGKASTLTWEHIAALNRLSRFIDKPLLVSMPLAATTNELQLIWNSGVDGIVVSPNAAGQIAALRQEVDKLKAPPRKARMEVVLPRPSLPEATEEAEEEEEDE